MKAYINHIIETIAAHSSDFENAGLTPPATIDVYMGQPARPEEFEFTLPAVFIDYSADYDGGTLDVIVHVVQDFGDDTENFAQQRGKGLDFMAFLSVLKKCLYGLKMRPVFNPLRLYQETPMQPDLYYYHMLILRCNFNTDLYCSKQQYIDAEPVTATLEGGTLTEHLPS